MMLRPMLNWGCTKNLRLIYEPTSRHTQLGRGHNMVQKHLFCIMVSHLMPDVFRVG